MDGQTDAGAPENAQDLTIFVQTLLEQMVREGCPQNLSGFELRVGGMLDLRRYQF